MKLGPAEVEGQKHQDMERGKKGSGSIKRRQMRGFLEDGARTTRSKKLQKEATASSA